MVHLCLRSTLHPGLLFLWHFCCGTAMMGKSVNFESRFRKKLQQSGFDSEPEKT